MNGVPEYTLAAVVSVVLVVLLEVVWLRTGIFRTTRFWISMLIVLGFQVLVDGWLTKLADPIVLYDEGETLGVRLPWDIPVEDFLFGFGMVTLTLLIWVRLGSTTHARPAPTAARRRLLDEENA